MHSTLVRASRAIPQRAKPPLFVVLNLALTVLFGFLASPWLASDLAAIARPLDRVGDYSSLVAWRIVEVLSYWLGGWDGPWPLRAPARMLTA